MNIVSTFIAVFIAGFASLQMELSLLREATFALGGSAFTNSMVISVFLAGLAIGSYLGNRLTQDGRRDSRTMFIVSQLVLALTVVVLVLTKDHFIYRTGQTGSVILYFCVMTSIPALVAGMNFSFFLNMLYAHGEKYIAMVYAVSTIGNVISGFLHGLVFVPAFGMRFTYVAVLVCVALAIFAVGPLGRKQAIAVVSATILMALFTSTRPLPAAMREQVLFSQDDVYGLVQVIDRSDAGVGRGGAPLFDLNIHGDYNCGNSEIDMARHERAGTLPSLLLGSELNSVLTLGYCSGATVDALLDVSDVERVVAVDMNRTVIEAAGIYFPEILERVRSDPRADIIETEFRSYLKRLSPDDQYDLVLIDILHRDPLFYGMFTLDFWRLVKSHIRPGGIQSLNAMHPQMMRTAGEAFEHVYVQTDPDGSTWIYLTDEEIPAAHREQFGFEEQYPWQEAGLVYSDHEVYQLAAGERLDRSLRAF